MRLFTTCLLLGLLSSAAHAGDDWRLVEADMRNAGCFVAPIATAQDALRSEDVLCRVRAVRVLGLRGERNAVPGLETLLVNDPEPLVRHQAAFELVRLGQSKYLEEARRILQETTAPGDKALLAGQLADVGDASGLPAVEEACRDADPQVRQMCTSAFWFFRKLAAGDPGLRAALVEQMVALLDDPAPEIRQSALYSLSAYGQGMELPAAAIRRLETLVAVATDPKVKEIAGAVVEDQQRKQHDDKKKQR
jgi:HEAT repeat protein